MLRSVTVSLALSVLAAACGLVEEPPPPGTRPFAARVLNRASQPAEIEVAVPAGVPSAVRPSVVGPDTVADVTLYVPTRGEWGIAINAYEPIHSETVAKLIGGREGCPFFIEVTDDWVGQDCVSMVAQVTNATGGQVKLTITNLAGVVRGKVEPASLPAGSTTFVIFDVPEDHNWLISVNGSASVEGREAERHYGRAGCLFQIELVADGANTGCLGD